MALGTLFHKYLTYVIPTPNKLGRFVTSGFRGVGKKIGLCVLQTYIQINESAWSENVIKWAS